jgi:thiol:disulfide interchange protein DsbA
MTRSLRRILPHAAALVFMLFAGAPAAQLTPGKDYRVINPPQPVESAGKVEVIEFFWYACPHCSSLQGPLNDWLKRKPADVEFKRAPAAFHESWLQLARTYYAIEAMGLVDKLHHDVFTAIHEQRSLDPKQLLRDPKPLFDWVAGKGVDRQKFVDAYNSFAINGRTRRTLDITRSYDIPGTPAIVVDGKYLTAPSMTLNADNTVNYARYFQVLDGVIALARKERAGK